MSALSAEQRRRTRLIETATLLRPELHRYCSRLMGSAFEGEDVVQDTLERAFAAFDGLSDAVQLRPWLFRIAHNRALDLLRSRALRSVEPMEAALDVEDQDAVDPLEAVVKQEIMAISLTHFLELNTMQRSAVILKDVLGESLQEIAGLLGLTIDAVKAHLARGRLRLRALGAHGEKNPQRPSPSAAVSQYVELFNDQNWDGLRALLADDVKLDQSSRSVRIGRQSVGAFFSNYASLDPVRLVPAWMDAREVIAVFEAGSGEKPSYVMWLEWHEGRIRFIHDYRYARYMLEGAELQLARDDTRSRRASPPYPASSG